LLAEILNFQGANPISGMGSLSQIIIFRMNDYEVKEEILEKNDLHEHNVYAGNSKCVYSNSFCIQYQTGKKECKKYDGTDCCF